MFIIKHKSSFTDLKPLALKVRRLLKHPQDLSLIFFLFQCSIYIEVAVEKESANRTAVGLPAAPQGSVSDGRLPRGPKGAKLWAERFALVAAAARSPPLPLLGPSRTAGATATPNISARRWAAPCFGLKSRLCKNCFLLPPPLQARSSVLTDPARCAVAHPHMHGSSDISWI